MEIQNEEGKASYTRMTEMVCHEDLSVSEELKGLFEKFPDIDEFDFDQLSPYVMQFHIECFLTNPKEDKG